MKNNSRFNFAGVLFDLHRQDAVILHLQILQEEKYLPAAYGEEYMSYK